MNVGNGWFGSIGAAKSGAGARLGWWWLEYWMKYMEAGRGSSTPVSKRRDVRS